MRAVLKTKRMLFVCVDIQERLLELMAHKDSVIKNANILLQAAQILDIPLLVTEQYPKGLGKTHSAIILPQNAATSPNAPKANAPVLEKTSFGIFGDEAIREHIAQSKAKTLVFFGIESHICVLQSLIEARNLGYECILAADSSSSRDVQNHALALEFARSLGVSVLPTESILFRILGDSKNEHFKAISQLVK